MTKHFSTWRPLKANFLCALLLTVYLELAHGESDVMNMLFSNYDKALRPDFGSAKPTIVYCTLTVESFGNIEEANMEYRVYTYFHQKWNDSRLAGKLNYTLAIKGKDISNIWVPDPYCYNARESNMMMSHEETHNNLKIKPNGEIMYSKGVSFLASCIMNLRNFPLDSQKCHLKFGSYGHTMEDMVFRWGPGETEIVVEHKEMAQFRFVGSELESDVHTYHTRNFSTMKAKFSFERRIGYYLIQVYFPNIFVVVLSWIVFWMEKDDIGNRMALGITTILTIMFLLGSLNGNLPKVSYPKALDWYLLVSFSFVFLSLIESTAVFLFAVKANKNEKMKCKKHSIPLTTRITTSLRCMVASKSADVKGDHDSYKGVADDDLERGNRPSKVNKTVVDDVDVPNNRSAKIKRMERKASKIDSASRVLFPLAFLLYNIFYWTYYSNFFV